jgi:hypothetical protein
MESQTKKPGSFLPTLLIILVTALVTAVLVVGGMVFYVVKANPFNIQACVISSFFQDAGNTGSAEEGGQAEGSGHPLLSDDQEQMLESSGIEVESLPQEISPEMEACFEDKLGKDRVEEIKAGDQPSSMELFKARSCL